MDFSSAANDSEQFDEELSETTSNVSSGIELINTSDSIEIDNVYGLEDGTQAHTLQEVDEADGGEKQNETRPNLFQLEENIPEDQSSIPRAEHNDDETQANAAPLQPEDCAVAPRKENRGWFSNWLNYGDVRPSDVEEYRTSEHTEISIHVSQNDQKIGDFVFLDEKQFLEGKWNMNCLDSLHSCQFNVDDNTVHLRKLGTNYLLTVNGQNYVAQVALNRIKINLNFRDSLWTHILSKVSVIHVFEDELANKRTQAFHNLEKALGVFDQCDEQLRPPSTAMILSYLQSKRTKPPRVILELLQYLNFVPDFLRKAAGELLETELALHKRKVINFFAGRPSSLNLVDIIDAIYERGSKRHKELLLRHCPSALPILRNSIESLPPKTILSITKADVVFFYHLVTITEDPQILPYFEDFADKFLSEVKKSNLDNLLNGTNPTVNPVLTYLFKSFYEIMNEILRICDDCGYKDLLIRKGRFLWRLTDIIQWPCAVDENNRQDYHLFLSLESQLRFLFKLMSHFQTKGLYKKSKFEYQMQSSKREVPWCTKLRLNNKLANSSVWLYLLDCTVKQVVVDKILSFEEFCRWYEPLMSSHWMFVTKSTTERHESFRVVTHNVVKYIVRTSSLFNQTTTGTNTIAHDILCKQMDCLKVAVDDMKNDASAFDCFRDLIGEYIKFWDLHCTLKSQYEGEHSYLADQLTELFEHIIHMILSALGKSAPVRNLSKFLRCTNEFLSDYQNMAFTSTWYVKSRSKNEIGLERVNNKIAYEIQCSYFVRSSNQYLGSIQTSHRPPHYNIRIVRKLIDCVNLALQKNWITTKSPVTGQLDAASILLGGIRRSLVYLKEQPDYRDFSKYECESIQPFLSAVDNCFELEAFEKRIETLIQSFWHLRKFDEIGVDKAVNLTRSIFGDKIRRHVLTSCYNRYMGKFHDYIGKQGNSVAEKVLQIVNDLERHRQSRAVRNWDQTYKTEVVPDVLAGLSAIWSLTVSEDVTISKKLLQPHCIQILCALRLMGADKRQKGVQNHLAQILTGQGKSLVLALISAVFALAGHNVFIVCYSNYLVKRDASDFKGFFQTLRISEKVEYITIQELAEKCMNPIIDGNSVSLRGCLLEHVLQHKPLPNLTSASFNFSNTVLLVDEVDVFFSGNVYGSVKKPALKLYIDGLGGIQEFIWEKVTSGCSSIDVLLEKIEEYIVGKVQSKETAFIEFDNLMKRSGDFKILEVENDQLISKKYSSNQEFWQKQFREMAQAAVDAKNLVNNNYAINQNGMLCQRNPIDGTFSAAYISYHAVFVYFKLKEEDFDDMYGQNYSYIPITAGHISYAKLPTDFSLVLGVSGTLENAYQHEIQAMTETYKILSYTASPSFFGGSNLNFTPEDDVRCFESVNLWRRKLFERAHELIRSERSVIMFFDCQAEINSFMSEYGNRFAALYILTEDTKEKKLIIDQAGVASTLTLATRGMGRGIDYKSSLATEKSGGVHIIQTFFSADVKEEMQIKGRTARKDNKGSYEMILCLNHLTKPGGLLSGNLDSHERALTKKSTSPNCTCETISFLELLERKRKDHMERYRMNSAKNVEKYRTSHQTTMKFYGLK